MGDDQTPAGHRVANGCADVSSHAGIMGRWSFVPNWRRNEGGKKPPFRRFDRLRIIYRSPLRASPARHPRTGTASLTAVDRIVPIATGTL